jgi:hypothetical protein
MKQKIILLVLILLFALALFTFCNGYCQFTIFMSVLITLSVHIIPSTVVLYYILRERTIN